VIVFAVWRGVVCVRVRVCGVSVCRGRVLVAGRRPRTERSNQYRIKNYLLRNYDRTTRPVINDSAPVDVQIAISLYHILDTVVSLSPSRRRLLTYFTAARGRHYRITRA